MMKPFDRFESPPRFSSVNAYLLSLICHYQYAETLGDIDRADTRGFVEAYQAKFSDWGMNRHQFYYLDQSKSTQGFVMADDKRIFVGFRGSEVAAGWEHVVEDMLKTNTKAIFPLKVSEFAFKVDVRHLPDSMDPVVSPRVHRGFYEAYQEIRQQLIYSLEQVGILHGKELYLTGHSLGGAIAILAAYDLTKNYGYKPDGIYTYGMPRVGFQPLGWRMDHDFRSFYNDRPYLDLYSRTFRMVNLQHPKTDGVVTLPPVTGLFQAFSGNYEHVGTLVHINPDHLEINAFEKVLGIPDFGIHSSVSYTSRLHRILEKNGNLQDMPEPPPEEE
ncbi:MAG: lipase family protein [Bacteroidota bacterium]